MGIALQYRQTLFIDTAPLIYYFEDHERYAPIMDDVFMQVKSLNLRVVTSIVSYIEILTMPQRMGDTVLVAKYKEYLTCSAQVSVYPVDVGIADAAVLIRAQYGFKTPDAIQLATAQVCGADHILSNDRRWDAVRKHMPIVMLSELINP